MHNGISMLREEVTNEQSTRTIESSNQVVDVSELISALTTYQNNPKQLNEQQLDTLKIHIDGIKSLLENNNSLPSNLNLQTQRR